MIEEGRGSAGERDEKGQRKRSGWGVRETEEAEEARS